MALPKFIVLPCLEKNLHMSVVETDLIHLDVHQIIEAEECKEAQKNCGEDHQQR